MSKLKQIEYKMSCKTQDGKRNSPRNEIKINFNSQNSRTLTSSRKQRRLQSTLKTISENVAKSNDPIGSSIPLIHLQNNKCSVPKNSGGKLKLSNPDSLKISDENEPNQSYKKIPRISVHNMDLPACKAIIAVLKKEYLNVSKRANLNYEPKCVVDFSRCVEHHKKKFEVDKAKFHEEANLRNVLNTEEPLVFVRLIDSMCLRKKFPSTKIIVMLLEHMLAVNNSSLYDAKAVIEMAALTFAKILVNFPPCCRPCKPIYHEVITRPIADSILPKDKFIPEHSLLINLLNILDIIIEEGKIVDAEIASTGTDDDDCSFTEWNDKNGQKFSFEKLTRKEKVQRIFLVLGLLIQLMEVDLSMWMITYAKNRYDQFHCPSDNDQVPLIASFLWPDGVFGEVNYIIKKTLKSFVNYVSIDFSIHKVDIFSRLIDLIFTCLNICDTPSSIDVKYPIIGRCTKLFCDTLNQTIYENRLYSAKLYLKVIKRINSPIARLLISNKLIGKLNHNANETNPRAIYNIIIAECLLDREREDEMSQTSNEPFELNSSQFYPCMQKQNHLAVSSLSDEKYIDLLHMAFQAYVDTYHVDKVIDALAHDIDDIQQKLTKQFEKEIARNTGEHELIVYDNWNDVSQLEEEKLMANANNHLIFPNDIVSHKLLPALTLTISAKELNQYREDIKYYEKICTVIDKSQNDYFVDWFPPRHVK